MTDRLRVLQLTSSLQPGGAERNIVSVMPHLPSPGVQVALCTLTGRGDGPLAGEYARTGLARFDIGASRLADPAAVGRLVRLLRAGRVDVVHAHDQDGIVMGAVAGALTRVPVVMSRHVIVEPSGDRRQSARARLAIAAFRFRAARVIAVSAAVRESLAAAHVDPSSVTVVHNGVDARPFDAAPGRARARALLGADGDVTLVLVPAVLRPGKGHDVMLRATAALRERAPGLRVLLAGDGPSRGAIERAAAGVPSVRLLGHRDDIPLLMAAADIVALPSLHEGLPTVLIEAALAGRPVVASDVGGAGEIVRTGITGLLVPPGDHAALATAIATLADDPARAEAMGAAARVDAATRFSLDRQAREMRAVYRQAAAA
jgi:glycosyltransferase involved in cell wall biosynthesis